MRPYKLRLVPGQEDVIGVVGDYVRIKSAGVPITVRVEGGDSVVTLEQGDAAFLKEFDRLAISADSLVEQEVIVEVGRGTRLDSSKVGGSVAVSNLQAACGVYSQTVHEVTSAPAQLKPAAQRRFLLVQNRHSVGGVWLNLAGGAATLEGVFVPPGGSLLLDSYPPSGSIGAVGDIASNQSVTVVEG